MTKVASFLNQHLTGSVFASQGIIDAFSTDRSILRIRPQAVAQPLDVAEVRKLIRFSYQLSAKGINYGITPRGSGSDTTGACLGSGIVISTAKLNHIKEIDPRQRLVRVEAGVKLGELNQALALHSLTLPVDAAPERTIGGLIANTYNSALHDAIEQAEVVLANGELIHTEPLSRRALKKKLADKSLESDIYRYLDKLATDNPGLLEILRAQHTPTGYPGLALARYGKRFDLLPLFFGSQGTLGMVTEVILRCEYLAPPPLYITAAYEQLADVLALTDRAAALKPSVVNIYDCALFNAAAAGGKNLRILEKRPETGYLVLLAFEPTNRRAHKRIVRKLRRELAPAVDSAASAADHYDHRLEIEAIVEHYLNQPGRHLRLAVADAVQISPDQFATYLTGLQALAETYHFDLPYYGSLLSHTYTVRPVINPTTTDGRRKALEFLRDYSELVQACHGTLSGGTPEGRVKTTYLDPRADAPELAELDQSIKQVFDPRGILNPGVKINTSARSTVRELRTSADCGIITA
jgi:FAD/FMN-containing dehydrogenase